MGYDLFVEFSAEDNDVFEVAFGKRSPFFDPVIPNLGLAEEIESGPLDDAGFRGQRIGPKENRGAEDALKAAINLRYSLPPLLMPKMSNISAAVLKRIVGVFC